MGGNAIINGIESEGIDLTRADRNVLRQFLGDLVIETNGIWSSVPAERIIGSAYHLLDPECDLGPKTHLGDIDVLVERGNSFMRWMESNGSLPDECLAREVRPDGTIISIWEIPCLYRDQFGHPRSATVQVDFIPCEVGTNGHPDPFYVFSHSAPYEDMIAGIKGFHHKYLIQSLCATNLDIKELTPGGKISKKQVRSWYAFSVNRGLREKYEVARMRVSDIIARPIPTAESNYITDLNEIFLTLTDSEEIQFSFIDIMKNVILQLPDDRQKLVLYYYLEMLFGKGAQWISRDKQEDLEIKVAGIRLFYHEISDRLNFRVRAMLLIKDYYKGEIDIFEAGKIIRGE